MLKTMRARTFNVVMMLLIMGMPLVGHASVPDPFIYGPRLIGMLVTQYPSLQTAVRVGNTPTLQVFVHSNFGTPPKVSANLAQFGLSQSATTSGQWAGYGAQYYQAYFYNFGPLSVSTDTPDGLYEIPITATNAIGNTAMATTSILVDNALPTISLSNITFSTSTTSPRAGDYMYLSGSASGTGSALKVSGLFEGLFDANGNSISWYARLTGDMIAYNPRPIDDALASSTDGTFTNVPIKLSESDDPGQIARAVSFRVRITVYDEAGNTAGTSLTVPVPKPPPPDPCAVPGACASNVLFLPGIEGSRLYEGLGCGKTAEEKLWDPVGESLIKILRGAGDDKVKRLFLDSTGKGVCSDIYAKTDDIIDSVKGNNIYKSLIDEMNGLETNGTINDWKPVAYDWRLSFSDLLNKGSERDGKIFYTEATSTPYIEQTLRALAGSSKTKKVTIVAHSNGGLIAKALLNKLGGSTAKLLVDKIIMVGAPQSGAPVAIGALLYGLDQGISKWGIPILHSAVARELAQNSPMAYHLLPSEDYLESTASDSAHPVGSFAGDAYAKEIGAYGAAINNTTELDNFLLASSLNSNLVDYANSQHTALDVWAPPEGIEVSQIAGWGADTVAGIDFYTPPPVNALTALEPMRAYRPLFTEDGDGVVPVPSALMMASSTSVKRYWVDLAKINNVPGAPIKYSHKNILEISSLRDFIKNIIKNSTSTLPIYISTSQPSPNTENKKLTFFLHSPLTLQLTDASGNVTGLAEDNSITQDIPDSVYGEFGEVKYITVPQGSQYELTLHGQESGTFSLDIQESSGGVITASSTIASVPTTANTLVGLTISDGIDTASALTVDVNGDGTDIITLIPTVGETVNYEPLEDPEPVEGPAPASESEPTPESALPAQASPRSGGSRRGSRASTLAAIPAPVVTTVDAQTTITEPAVTNTPATMIPIAVTPPLRPPVATQSVPKRLQPPATVANTMPNFSQTASVYNAASQQPLFARMGRAVYNGLYGFWFALKKFF